MFFGGGCCSSSWIALFPFLASLLENKGVNYQFLLSLCRRLFVRIFGREVCKNPELFNIWILVVIGVFLYSLAMYTIMDTGRRMGMPLWRLGRRRQKEG